MNLKRYIVLLLSSASACTASVANAQEASEKAIVVLVSEADRMNIGQAGYCGKRTEIDSPKDKQLRIPAGNDTVFYLKTTFRLSYGTYTCEGDFSFKPESGNLHIIRYSMEDRQCRLELFRGRPGTTPQPMAHTVEPRRSCAGQ